MTASTTQGLWGGSRGKECRLLDGVTELPINYASTGYGRTGGPMSYRKRVACIFTPKRSPGNTQPPGSRQEDDRA
jgi:hypothetical protein